MTAFLYLSAALGLGGLVFVQRKQYSFSLRVFTALILAIVLGTAINLLRAHFADPSFGVWVSWLNFVGYGYVDLLRMVSIPLIMISVLTALVNIDPKEERIAKTVLVIVATLLVTVVLAALISLVVSLAFGLNSSALTPDLDKLAKWEQLSGKVQSVPQLLRSLLPRNPFLDMTGARSSSIAAVVIFSLFLAWGFLSLGRDERNNEHMATFRRGVNAIQKVIISMVKNVLTLTPYGIFAIMLRVSASTNLAAFQTLGKFLAATYVALGLVFVLHLLILAAFGYAPLTYVRKVWPTLSFAFTSRSSAGTLPLTIETGEQVLGLKGSIASVSSSLGATVGQNGCAGVWPAMLVVMVWNATGTSIGLWQVLSLIGVILISSLGVAGVGGGATFASIMVLSTLGLGEHLALAVVLSAIEPIADMGRTMINVSDSMVSGLVSGRLTGGVDMSVYNSSRSPANLVQNVEQTID
ncbi:MAG: cation:dicarboxylase symporter family transporter [Spirochaetota bacterium]